MEMNNGRIVIALLTLYICWSATYLAIRIGLESFPPFLMSGSRFFIAGSILYLFLRTRGEAAPDRSQWKGGAIVGGLLLVGGNGGVVYAEQWVASGLAALMVATTPLWTALFGGIWRHRPSRLEWAGLITGLIGIVLLNLDGGMKGAPIGAAALMLAAISWAFGSAWSRHLSLPSGMMASAVEMIAGGLLLLLLGICSGERMVEFPSSRAALAFLYLLVFGSLIGYSAYTYLINRVRPALATSYAYVNPILAVLLGIWLAGEHISVAGIMAMLVIIVSVVLVVMGREKD